MRKKETVTERSDSVININICVIYTYLGGMRRKYRSKPGVEIFHAHSPISLLAISEVSR